MSYKSIINAVVVAAAVMAVMFVGCGSDDNDDSDGHHSVVKGTFTDIRDGTSYKTVKIGTQTWMAENLNYEIPDTDNMPIQLRWSMCYEINADNCATYGRLYNWETAETACPAGWHLPSYTEWNVLITYVGGFETAGTKLKSSTGWALEEVNGKIMGLPVGTDAYGFSALPGGNRTRIGRVFEGAGYYGAWWSATEVGGWAWVFDMRWNGEHVNRWDDGENALHSVRCVRD